jgi:hypothetical protein
MSEWLDRFNETARLIQKCQYSEALQILNELEPTIRAQPELTGNTFVLFEVRRATLCSSLDMQEESLARFQSAMKIAFHEVQDPIEVQSVVKKTLDTICEWGEWKLLHTISTNMINFAQQQNMPLVSVTAAWYLPYAFRGLGQIEKAREHAQAILERLEQSDSDDGVDGWREFLASLDEWTGE